MTSFHVSRQYISIDPPDHDAVKDTHPGLEQDTGNVKLDLGCGLHHGSTLTGIAEPESRSPVGPRYQYLIG